MEHDLLSIVETLKEFRNILLGQQIIIYTDHSNLTYKNFNTDRVMRWRLLVEEYNPEFRHIPGSKNIVADALSRLGLLDNISIEDRIQSDHTNHTILAECYGYDKHETKYLSNKFTPVNFTLIHKYQHQDQTILNKLNNGQYHLQAFVGGELSIELISYQNKIVVPRKLQSHMIQWYHEYLLHPGLNRTEETIRQHFYWSGMRKQIYKIVSTCDTCQKFK
jgi:hypothetical protein